MQDNKIDDKELKELIYYLHSISKIFAPRMNCSSILPPAEFFLLAFLLKSKKEEQITGIHPSKISEKTKISRPAVTQTLNGLEKKGYIKRIMEENDRRKFKVEITAEGEKILNNAFEAKHKQILNLVENLGANKVRQLTELCKEILEISKKQERTK